MSWYYNVNQKQITQGQALYNLMTSLVAAGWIVKGSGDGTGGNYRATSGSAITNSLHDGYGILNTGSWFRIQSPSIGSSGQKRELIFQQGSTGIGVSGRTTLRLKYSPNPTGATGFIGGSPSASQTPSATDEISLHINNASPGTDLSPSYCPNYWSNAYDYEFVQHIVCDNDGSNGYCWYLVQTSTNGAGSFYSCIAMDIMKPGTYTSTDTDPCVIYCSIGGYNGYGSEMRDATGIYCGGFVGGLASTNWTGMYLTNPNYYPATTASDTATSQDYCVIPRWVSGAAELNTANSCIYGVKGYSSLFLYNAQPRGNSYIMQITPNTGESRIYIQGLLLPWPPNTPAHTA